MKNGFRGLLNMKHFFEILESSDNAIKYTFKKPSQLLLKNIHINWLQSIHAKTHRNMPVYLNKPPSYIKRPEQQSCGYIRHQAPDKDAILEYKLSENALENQSLLQLELVIPQQNIMQSFIQWQRYRKYWWSYITTTPSLFTINDISNEDKTAKVDLIAQLPCGQQAVETITIKSDEFDPQNKSCLTCTMHLERALFILLLDGSITNSDYLRIHRKMAPFKMSFALNVKDIQHKDTLIELAKLLHHKLRSMKISTLLPIFSLPLESQIKENLNLGVPYTAILNRCTLDDGTFELLNSSTMLKEQVHVAAFHSYAELIC